MRFFFLIISDKFVTFGRFLLLGSVRLPMKSIKPLPEGVRSTVRSGVILFDLTRVVEELVFNSLDAGATKVIDYNNGLLAVISIYIYLKNYQFLYAEALMLVLPRSLYL